MKVTESNYSKTGILQSKLISKTTGNKLIYYYTNGNIKSEETFGDNRTVTNYSENGKITKKLVKVNKSYCKDEAGSYGGCYKVQEYNNSGHVTKTYYGLFD